MAGVIDDSMTEAKTIGGGEWFGQPRGLTILFLTEMWDQFSFFGMRALLVLYMTKHLLISQQKASWIYGLYAAFAYLTPVLGGIITDRWLGRRYSVLIGGVIMAVGHFMMAFEPLLYVALGTIVLGNGLFLPSLPSQIDSLYTDSDPRRISAYNVYYVGINLGAFAAPLVVGTIGEFCGFHWGFSSAGVGMLAALAIYITGSCYLPPEPPRISTASAAAEKRSEQGRPFRRRMLMLASITAAVVIFRGAYEQIGNTIALWADQAVNRSITAGLTIPVTWFLSLNSMMVFLLTPPLVAYWSKMANRGAEPAPITKMAIGAIIVGISYLVIAIVSLWADARTEQVSWPWMAVFIIVLTAGELWILPVGMGLFCRLAPAGMTATTIAIWYSAGFLGNLFAGWLGTLWSSLSHGMFFSLMAVVALVAALLMLLLAKPMNRMDRDDGFAKMRREIADFSAIEGRPPHMLVVEMGQDSRDRGAQVIATAFADLGFNVEVGPLFQTPAEAARQVVDNDVHVIGISSQAAGHETLVPEPLAGLKSQGAVDVMVIVGGVVPQLDYEVLTGAGVAAVVGPGTNLSEVAGRIVAQLRALRQPAA